MSAAPLIDPAGRWAMLTHGQSLPMVALRFAGVGAINALVFLAGTWFGIRALGWSPVLASLLGYALSAPVGFIGHRRVSFRSQGHPAREALRFAVVQAFNIGLTLMTMAGAVDRLGLQWLWGGMGVVVLVPIANFALSRLWVFRRQG